MAIEAPERQAKLERARQGLAQFLLAHQELQLNEGTNKNDLSNSKEAAGATANL